MIRIKAVDAQNLMEVCRLSASQGCGSAAGECACCNAVSIAQAEYCPELHPNAIYYNNALVGFFLYQRPESRAETATIRRFMIDGRFQQDGLEEKAFGHILRGFKIQGVKKVAIAIDNAEEAAKDLYLSFGFHLSGEIHPSGLCYELEL